MKTKRTISAATAARSYHKRLKRYREDQALQAENDAPAESQPTEDP